VYAASLNPFDWKLRAGYMKEMIPLKFPFTIGGDFSGVVTNLGENVSEFRIGDEVYGQALVLNGGSGAVAQVCSSNVANTSLKPESVDFLQAAALPLVGASAIQALEEHIKLKSKQKILIHGGAGGIGSIAIQLARSKGAHVATTVSTDNVEFVKELGADKVIDYKTQKFEERLHDFDAVFDTVGGETTEKSFKVLKKGGIIVSMLGAPNPELAKQYGVTAIGQNTKTTSTKLNRLRELVGNGAIKTHIDKVFPLEQTKEAFEYLEKGHPRGKVVVKIKG
jgi:NADPH:quinone reductase-like Zn-dependent oxidoreductase